MGVLLQPQRRLVRQGQQPSLNAIRHLLPRNYAELHRLRPDVPKRHQHKMDDRRDAEPRRRGHPPHQLRQRGQLLSNLRQSCGAWFGYVGPTDCLAVSGEHLC